MKRFFVRCACFLVAALMLALDVPAMAQTWSAHFSQNDLQPVAEEEIERVTAHLLETLGETDEETGNTNSFQIAGLAQIDGEDWYVGRWSWLVDDHMSVVTDFLLDPVSLEMFSCVYLDSETIEWYDNAETVPGADNGSEAWPYMSERGFSLGYDTTLLTPAEDENSDVFESAAGDGVRLTIVLVDELSADQYEGFLAEAAYDGDAVNYQLEMNAGTEALCAAVTRGETTAYYYLVPFGSGALAISGETPTAQAGEWGARFDTMVESITF